MTPNTQFNNNRQPQTPNNAPSTDTLLNLLEDQDALVSFLALEQLLHRDNLQQIISDNQDAPNLARRRKIHQLAAVSGRLDLQRRILLSIRQGKCSVWKALSAIDLLYDTQSSQAFIDEKIASLQYYYHRETGLRLEELGNFCANNGFVATRTPLDNIGFYLVGDVLDRRIGSSGLLCAIAKRIARQRMHLNYCLRAGHICLLDKQNNVLDPSDAWKVFPKVDPRSIRQCSDTEIISILLCQMLTVSITLWSQHDIYLFASLLSEIYSLPLGSFPYPLGDKSSEEAKTPAGHPLPQDHR